MTQQEEKFSGAPLADHERAELRRIIAEKRISRWVWGSMYRLIAAIGVVATGIIAIKTLIEPYFK